MKKRLGFLLLCLPAMLLAGNYSTSLVVQTGMLQEGDLVVRHITDLASKKTCLAFYVRTPGTSPTIDCYDVVGDFGTTIRQISHIKRDDIVIRNIEDIKHDRSCLVAYVTTPGTSPALACYTKHQQPAKTGNLRDSGHLREGDLEVYRVTDTSANRVCLVAHVQTTNTAPSVYCYDAVMNRSGGLRQTEQMREGDLIVRKIVDEANGMACMVTYVATPGTSSRLFCFAEKSAATAVPANDDRQSVASE